MLDYTRMESLASNKHSSLSDPSVSFEEIYEYGSRYQIHNTSFSLQLTKGTDKLECYIRLGWKGLLRTNALAYWVNS